MYIFTRERARMCVLQKRKKKEKKGREREGGGRRKKKGKRRSSNKKRREKKKEKAFFEERTEGGAHALFNTSAPTYTYDPSSFTDSSYSFLFNALRSGY
jgi:hypothetical protein